MSTLRRTHLLAFVMAVVFTSVLFWINNRHYLAYDLHGPDVAPFYQGMWHTLRGKIMFTTLNEDRSVLSYHFTPYFVLISPLLLLWEDVRIFFLVQIIGFAIAGLLLYWLVWRNRPKIAPLFLLAFFLNPSLHQIAFNELRRVTLAVPYIVLTLVALHLERRWLMLVALILALSCKENVSVFVFMVGVYLLIFERDWRWGAPIALLGLGSAVLIPTVVIPALTPPDVPYGGLSEFAYLGSTPSEIVTTALRDPGRVLAHSFDREALNALWKLFLPLGLFLPILAPRWFIIGLPMLGLLLVSGNPRLHQLQDWYPATILPIFYFAIGLALTRHSQKVASLLSGWLLITTVIGYLLYSFMPFGGASQFARYERTAHHDLIETILQQLPPEAIVATQTGFQPHLANRPRLYTYPWYNDQQAVEIDYYFFDRQANPYPFDSLQLGYEIDNVVADVNNTVVAEGDGIYLIGRNSPSNAAFSIDAIAEETIKLDKVEVAVLDERGIYLPTTATPLSLTPGAQLRVALYWEAVGKPVGERTVSIRIADQTSGALHAQQDAQPSGGGRATTVWETGLRFRDTYYLTVDANTSIGSRASLDILLYDSFTIERVPFSNGREILRIANITIVE